MTVSPSMLCGIGGCLLGGCTWSRGGVCSGGCTWSGGVSALGGVPGPRGVSAPGGGGVCSRGRGCLLQGVNVVPGRCMWSQGVSVPGGGGACSGGCTWSQGGVPSLRGVSALGGCLLLWWGGGVSGLVLPPRVDRQTPVNLLPCPKLCLRAVKNNGDYNKKVMTALVHLVVKYFLSP